MADLDSQAAALVASLVSFRDRVNTDKPEAVDSLNAIGQVLQKLPRDFNLDLVDQKGRKRNLRVEAADNVKLERRLRDSNSKIQKLQDQVDESSGSKLRGRLRKTWFVRAGLSNTSVPAQTSSQLFRDFSVEEEKKLVQLTSTLYVMLLARL